VILAVAANWGILFSRHVFGITVLAQLQDLRRKGLLFLLNLLFINHKAVFWAADTSNRHFQR